MGIFSFFSKKKEEDIKDAWEGIAYIDYEVKLIDAKVNITYIDIKNQKTNRDFSVKRFFYADDEKEYFIQGRCQLRDANRTFRIGRVEKLADLETGEIINQGKYVDFFEEIYRKSPAFLVEKVIDEYTNELIILVYLCRLNGRFTAKEKTHIFNYLNHQKNGILTDVHKTLIEAEIKDVDFTPTKANKAISTLKSDKNFDSREIIEVIEEISRLTKTINPVTKAGIEMVLKKL